ncbi:MAG: trigger factor, partial [Deferrisomatales bacterium]
EGRTLVLGSGMFIPGFEEGLQGAVSGEERTIEVTFPEDYRAENLAGKAASFRVVVSEAKVSRLPELDDEFARSAAGVDDVAALRAKVREAVEAEKASRINRAFGESVIDALLEHNPFEVPESLVRSQQAHSLERLRQDLAQRNIDPKALGLDQPQIQEGHRRAAERAIRWAFLMRAIADAEGLAASDQDVDERLRAIAEADGRPLSLIRSFFEQDDRLDGLRSSILEGKVIDAVVAASTVAEVEAGEGVGRE